MRVPHHNFYYVYLLLTAIGLMPGGSVYKDHTFNKETVPTSRENSTIHRTNTIQVYEHPQYKYMNIRKHGRKQKLQKKTQKIQKKTR
jgi:hypothetical protein